MLYQDLIFEDKYEKKEETDLACESFEGRHHILFFIAYIGWLYENQSTKHGIEEKDTKSAARMPALSLLVPPALIL